jgi:hypothetical protein
MAEGALSFDIKIVGLDEALRKLDSDILLGKPLHDFFERASQAVGAQAKERAAVDTGHMRSRIYHKVSGARLPLWARVIEPVHTYPGVLETDPRYHYAAGPRAGQQTLGWFSGAAEQAQPELERSLNDLANDIERRFGG